MKNKKSKIIIFSLLMAAASGYAIAQDAALKVSGPDAMKAATEKIQPEYPNVAKQLAHRGRGPKSRFTLRRRELLILPSRLPETRSS